MACFAATDMVVKSKKAKNHLKDLEEAFNILDKLKSSKCHFGVGNSWAKW